MRRGQILAVSADELDVECERERKDPGICPRCASGRGRGP